MIIPMVTLLDVRWRSRGWDGEPGRAMGSPELRKKKTLGLV